MAAEVSEDGEGRVFGLPVEKGILDGGLRGGAAVGETAGGAELGRQVPWVEAEPPEFTLWALLPDIAVEPKPRAKLPDDASKPDPDSNIGALFAAYFPHGGDHGAMFSVA